MIVSLSSHCVLDPRPHSAFFALRASRFAGTRPEATWVVFVAWFTQLVNDFDAARAPQP
jgi:hypothetical protein